MDWAVISGMADAAAAFGVIGSLVFVGFQVRQNSEGLHIAAVQSLMSTYQDLFVSLIDSKDFAEISHQAFRDPESLEDASLMRFYAYGSKMFRVYQGMHWQWRRGAIDDGLFNSLTTFLEDIALAPGWQHFWRERRHQYDPDFQKFVDAIMEGGKGKPLFD